MCTARDGKWKNQKVCVKEQYKCDRVVHCKGKHPDYEDETNCNQEATSGCRESDCNKAYKPVPKHCDGDEVMCTARDGKFAGKKICVEKKFQCDNHLQCEDGTDEEACEEEYKKRGTFKKDHHFICRKTYMNISNDTGSGKFFPMRAVRWVSVIIIIFGIIIYNISWSGAT